MASTGDFLIGLGIFLVLVFLGMIGYSVYLLIEDTDVGNSTKYARGGAIGGLAVGCIGAGFLIKHGMQEKKNGSKSKEKVKSEEKS